MITYEYINEYIDRNELPVEKVKIGDDVFFTIFDIIEIQQNKIKQLEQDLEQLKADLTR